MKNANDEGWMKNDERWRMKDDDFKLLRGFDDEWTIKHTFVNVEWLLRLKIVIRILSHKNPNLHHLSSVSKHWKNWIYKSHFKFFIFEWKVKVWKLLFCMILESKMIKTSSFLSLKSFERSLNIKLWIEVSTLI